MALKVIFNLYTCVVVVVGCCVNSATKQNAGTGLESCKYVDVGQTTEFSLLVILTDCEQFGTESK